MLTVARDAVVSAGWQIGNVDCIVFAERPKLQPYKQSIRRRLAEILAVSIDQVGLQAKTGEKLGAVGREEALAAQCVALLLPHGGSSADDPRL
jgi:2-C-methyl-D-erythritol 2,4-cyclodiphosphate synthase